MAAVYSREFERARKHLEGVSSEYWHGAARILEAAALGGIIRTKDAKDEKLIRLLETKFQEGYKVDPAYWNNLFSGGRDPHLGYDVPIKILVDIGIVK